jgi:hypothetical protein
MQLSDSRKVMAYEFSIGRGALPPRDPAPPPALGADRRNSAAVARLVVGDLEEHASARARRGRHPAELARLDMTKHTPGPWRVGRVTRSPTPDQPTPGVYRRQFHP